MRLLGFWLLGAVNACIFLSIFINSGFFELLGRFTKNTESFVSFATQLSMYVTTLMFALYCFKHKLRSNEKVWKVNFILNACNLVALVAAIVLVKGILISNSKVGGDLMMVFAPFGVVFTLNLAMLLYRVPKSTQENSAEV